MIEMILLALLAAKLRKYRLTPIFKEWALLPVLLFALLYIVLQVFWFQGYYSVTMYTRVFQVLIVASLALLIIKHGLYKPGFIGVACIAAGGLLNGIVIKANGGKMPVFPSISYVTGYLKPDSFEKAAGYDTIHVMGGPSTRLAFLADRFDIGYTILSIGDIFIYLMIFVIIYSTIASLNKRKISTGHQQSSPDGLNM